MTPAADLLPDRNHRYAAPGAFDLFVFPEEFGRDVFPEFFTFPVTANTLVPFEVSVPIPANQAGPFRKMTGMFANVSTLLMQVGFPQSPLMDGKGGRGLG